MSILTDIRSVNPGSLITLFELDTTKIDANRTGGTYSGISKYYFHNGTNQYGNAVVWQGITYERLPVEATGFEMTTKGTLPKPTLRISNLFMTMTSLIQQKGDLVGAKLTRRRTMHRYLDAVNFSGGASYNWPTTRQLTYDTTGLVISGTNVNAYYNTCSSSGMSSTINGGKTYYWEVTVDEKNVAGTCRIVVGISNTSNSTTVQNAADPTGRGYYSNNGYKYVGTGYAYGPTYGTGDTIGVVYDSAVGSLHFFKNGVPCSLELNGITSKAAFDAVNPTGLINPALIWYPTVSIQSGTGTTAKVTCNFGNTAFKYSIPANIPNRVATDIVPVYGNKTADPNAEFPDDIFYVNRKSLENNKVVEYELSTALDIQMVKLPRRQIIQNTCLWEYRGESRPYPDTKEGCPYAGTNYFKADDSSTIFPTEDVCGKKLSSCKLRFSGRLPYGGFPGVITR